MGYCCVNRPIDPHITLDSALYQAKRVSSARNMPEKLVVEQINRLAEYNAYVNVLLLNLAMDSYAR